MKKLFFLTMLLVTVLYSQTAGIYDHHATDITSLTQEDIQRAKDWLHIAYGHTSHGSQITDGMTGLVTFANNGGKGLSFPTDFFKWNNGGSGGALDLMEGDGYGSGAMDHDCGYYPNWVNETTSFLGTPDANGRGANNPDVNVIMWSWCGQVSSKGGQTLIDEYLAPMAQFEADYPGITFIYMTGHADGGGESGSVHINNQQIRQFCIENHKILFDFYDLDCHDPDGNYYGDKNVTDNCDYDSDGNGSNDKNWAIDWQNSHTENTEWYSCGSAHSQPLNANQKAYAAWKMFAEIARAYDTTLPVEMSDIYTRSEKGSIVLYWKTESEVNNLGFNIYRSLHESAGYEKINFQVIPGAGNSTLPNLYQYTDDEVVPNQKYWYRVEDLGSDGTRKFHGPISGWIGQELQELVEFKLYPCYPNPFNPGTKFKVSIPKQTAITLTVIDLSGNKISEIFSGGIDAGIHEFHFDATGLPSGLYFYQLTCKNDIAVEKMVLMK
ncbi:MAG: T9SS type A sorting domain-containing protein [Candidatus Marinimicrobia bacterium]|nr:T9SS type A sorting domain-containing protein [Candidatus Neomarinimicrobiota bacterium]